MVDQNNRVRHRRCRPAVDACAREAHTRALCTAIESIAGRQTGLLVNPHAHGDHTFGKKVFTPDPPVRPG
jgi:cyclase